MSREGFCIEAHREEECLVIRVVDDGIGMSRDKVEELLASDEEIKGKMRTIGVANVSRRNCRNIWGRIRSSDCQVRKEWVPG